jgi:hypothetical protein
MKMIERKKTAIAVNHDLQNYLAEFDRVTAAPIEYSDLLRYNTAVALYDKRGEDTLWSTVGYDALARREIHAGLLQIYANLRAQGDRSIMQHLIVDRIDLCMYGNSQPFRIRIVNTLNENFDYFYVKSADASRVYGLELEHILSPDRIGFFVSQNTLIEEHIYGIPGDIFIRRYFNENLNEVRLAKEFVKFNERSFIRLLGDMHSANFVVDITVDFEENMYRIRAIDFDQQSYEPRKVVYLPQYYKENNPIVALCMKHLTSESVRQYQSEERALIFKRVKNSSYRLKKLLAVMQQDRLAPEEHVQQLAEELAEHYQSQEFLRERAMGGLVRVSLSMLDRRPH